MNMKQATYSHHWFLTAGECDATGRMPLTLLGERIIEVATEHANALGIGYANLVTRGIGWVLSRLSIEMTSWPGINDTYSMTTWIETINHRFSERNVMIADASGSPIGYARTVWAPIDFKTRGLADLGPFSDGLPTADLPCPIERFPRIRMGGGNLVRSEYTFKYCDLDFNRHVNTVRYISLLLNQWPLQHFDAYCLRRFDIGFARECYFGQTVSLLRDDSGGASLCELQRGADKVLSARFVWEEKSAGDEPDRD